MSGFWDKMTQEKPLIKVKESKNPLADLANIRKRIGQLENDIAVLKNLVAIIDGHGEYPVNGNALSDYELTILQYTQIDDIRKKCKKAEYVRARVLFTLLCNTRGYSKRHIAKYLGVQRSDVINYDRMKSRYVTEKDYKLLKI